MNIPTVEQQRRETFLKAVIVTNKAVHFTHLGEQFHLTSPCFESLEGKTVLVNTAMELFRSEKKIGNATRVL